MPKDTSAVLTWHYWAFWRQYFEIEDRGDRNDLTSVPGLQDCCDQFRWFHPNSQYSMHQNSKLSCFPTASMGPLNWKSHFWLNSFVFIMFISLKTHCYLPALRCGFITAVKDVLSVKENGLMAGGPPCGPWIWINAATHCRKKWAIFGDTTKEYVRASNTSLQFT